MAQCTNPRGEVSVVEEVISLAGGGGFSVDHGPSDSLYGSGAMRISWNRSSLSSVMARFKPLPRSVGELDFRAPKDGYHLIGVPQSYARRVQVAGLSCPRDLE